MVGTVGGLHPERRGGDDHGQEEADDHGQGQQPNPFWSQEVRDEHLLEQARPRELPDRSPSENLLELDLEEDELRTASESTPPSSWEPLANHGGPQSDAVGSQSVHVSAGWPTGVATRGTSRSSEDGIPRDSRLQSLLEDDMAEGGRWPRCEETCG